MSIAFANAASFFPSVVEPASYLPQWIAVRTRASSRLDSDACTHIDASTADFYRARTRSGYPFASQSGAATFWFDVSQMQSRRRKSADATPCST